MGRFQARAAMRRPATVLAPIVSFCFGGVHLQGSIISDDHARVPLAGGDDAVRGNVTPGLWKHRLGAILLWWWLLWRSRPVLRSSLLRAIVVERCSDITTSGNQKPGTRF